MLNPDYRDMLSALLEANVEFVVVGAFALAAHGNPRSTGDIDIFVNSTSDNAKKLMEALRVFGAPLDTIKATDFQQPDTVFQIGIVPRRIDLLTSLEGIENFHEASHSSIIAPLEEFDIPVIGRETLIKNKRALGRPQDLADVAWLEANAE